MRLAQPEKFKNVPSPGQNDTRPRVQASLAECVLGATVSLQIPLETFCEDPKKYAQRGKRDAGVGVQLHIPPWSGGKVEAAIQPLLPGFGGPEGELLEEFLATGPKSVVVECEPIEETENTRFWRTSTGDLVADVVLSSEEVKNGFDRILRLGGIDIRAKWAEDVRSDELVPAGTVGSLRLFVHAVSYISGSEVGSGHFSGSHSAP